jgi:cell division protein FtsQ
MKMGAKRGTSAEVLDAPRESFGPETAWWGRGPAPAGALHRAYSGVYPDDLDTATGQEPAYVPRRGSLRGRFGILRRSLAGRIVLAVTLLAILCTAAVAAAWVRYSVLHDARFVLSTSDDIQVEGNAHLTRAQVLGVFAADLERNIFRMPLAERRADLERLPWVEHATVMRLLPDHVRVLVTERTPVAFVRQGTQIGLVDASGVLLDMPQEDAGNPRYSFPVLTGIEAGDPISTRAARMAIYLEFMKALDGGGKKLTNSISEVDVSNPEDVQALVTTDGSDVLVHFGEEDFLTRYNLFEDHLAGWKQQYPQLASADMRYVGQIVLEMKPGAAAASTADSGSAAASAAATTASAPTAAPAPAKKAEVAPVVKKAASPPVPKTVSKPATKPATKPVATAAVKPVVKPVAKPVAATAKQSDANAKMFAALAAEHKASLAKLQSGVKP